MQMNGERTKKKKLTITKIRYSKMIQPYKNIDGKFRAEKACTNIIY